MTEENTVTLMIAPAQDSAVIVLSNEILEMGRYAASLTIASDSDLRQATTDLSLIASLKKSLERKRKDYLEPFQLHTKDINNVFRFLTDPLAVADGTVRDKILAYRKVVDDKRMEEERINRLRLEAAEAEMKLKGEITEPVELVPSSPPAPSFVRTGAGSAGTVKVRKWEVIDFSAVPDEYKTIDAGQVTKQVKAGIGAIPGLRIYEEDIVRVSSW